MFGRRRRAPTTSKDRDPKCHVIDCPRASRAAPPPFQACSARRSGCALCGAASRRGAGARAVTLSLAAIACDSCRAHGRRRRRREACRGAQDTAARTCVAAASTWCAAARPQGTARQSPCAAAPLTGTRAPRSADRRGARPREPGPDHSPGARADFSDRTRHVTLTRCARQRAPTPGAA